MKYIKLFEADDIVHPVIPAIPGMLLNKYYYCKKENLPSFTYKEFKSCPSCGGELINISEKKFFEILKRNCEPEQYNDVYDAIKYCAVPLEYLSKNDNDENNIDYIYTSPTNSEEGDNYGYEEPKD